MATAPSIGRCLKEGLLSRSCIMKLECVCWCCFLSVTMRAYVYVMSYLLYKYDNDSICDLC
jgi:hypothetical protein